MPRANQNHITPTRRNVPCFSAAAIMAGFTVPNLASNPDAALIRACSDMMALDKEMNQLFAVRKTIEDEERTENELSILYEREAEIKDLLFDLDPPCTVAGVQALARVAVCRWQHYDQDGALMAGDFDEWCAASVLEFVVGVKA